MIHFEADGSDLTGAVTQTYREGKIMGRGEKRGGEGRGEEERQEEEWKERRV